MTHARMKEALILLKREGYEDVVDTLQNVVTAAEDYKTAMTKHEESLRILAGTVKHGKTQLAERMAEIVLLALEDEDTR